MDLNPVRPSKPQSPHETYACQPQPRRLDLLHVLYQILPPGGRPALAFGQCRGVGRGLQASHGRKALAERPLCSPRRARFAQAAAPGLRGLRPGVPRRGRGGEPDQAAPAFGEGLVPGLSRLRDRPAPGLAPQHQALATDAGGRLLRLRKEYQSPQTPPHGNVGPSRAVAGGKIDVIWYGISTCVYTLARKTAWYKSTCFRV